jgi:hypothetical protein
MFARVFNSKKQGQIVVMRTASEELEPEVRFHFKPKNLGVCTISATYPTSEEADQAFKNVDLEAAEQMTRDVAFPVSDYFNQEG